MSDHLPLVAPNLKNEDVFESSFQAETNKELNKIMESAFDTDWSPPSDMSNLLSPANMDGSHPSTPRMSISPIKITSPTKRASPMKLSNSSKNLTATPVKSISNVLSAEKWRDPFQSTDHDFLDAQSINRLSTSSDFFDSAALIQSINEKLGNNTHNNSISTFHHDRQYSAISTASSSTATSASGRSQRSSNNNSTIAIASSINNTIGTDRGTVNSSHVRHAKSFTSGSSFIQSNGNNHSTSPKPSFFHNSTSPSLNSSPRPSFSNNQNRSSATSISTRYSTLENGSPVLRHRSYKNSSSLSIGSNNNPTLSRRYSVVSNGSKKVIIKKRSPSVVQRTVNRRLSMNSVSYRKILMDNDSNRNTVFRSFTNRSSLSTIYNSPEVSNTCSNMNVNLNSNCNSNCNSPTLSRNTSSPSLGDPGSRFQRTMSDSSSLIGYRYSTRSFSTTIADSSFQYFDTFSLNYDDEGEEAVVIEDDEYSNGDITDKTTDIIETVHDDDDVVIYDDSIATAKYAVFYDTDNSILENDSVNDGNKNYIIDNDNDCTSVVVLDGQSASSVSSERSFSRNRQGIFIKNNEEESQAHNSKVNDENFEQNSDTSVPFNKIMSNSSCQNNNCNDEDANSLPSTSRNSNNDKNHNNHKKNNVTARVHSSLSSSNLLSVENSNISDDGNSRKQGNRAMYSQCSSNSSISLLLANNQNASSSLKSVSSATSPTINHGDNKAFSHSKSYSVSQSSPNDKSFPKEEGRSKNKLKKSSFVKSLFNNNKNKKYGHKSNRSISGKLGGSVSQMVSSFSNKDFFGTSMTNETNETNDVEDAEFDFHVADVTTNSSNVTNTNVSKKSPTMTSSITSSSSTISNSSSTLSSKGIKSVIRSTDYKDNLKFDYLSKNELFLFNGTPIGQICKKNKMDYVQLYKLMKICECSNNLVFQFEDFINLKLSQGDNFMFKKVTDSNCVEYFAETSIDSGFTNAFLKIIPFDGKQKFHEDDSSILICESVENLYKEVKTCKMLKDCQGFPHLVSSHVVKGSFSDTLLTSWDSNISLNSNKFRPDIYKKDQLYLVLTFDTAGSSLRDYKLKSWSQANKIFWNLVMILKSSEASKSFEHRDLNWENVLINDGCEDAKGKGNSFISFLQITLTGFKYSRISDVENDTVVSCELLSLLKNFSSNDDLLRYDIYKKMVNEFVVHKDWSKHIAKTNFLWLYYIAYKLFYCKGLTKPEANNSVSPSKVLSPMYDSPQYTDNLKEIEAYQALKYVLKSLDPFNMNSSKMSYSMGYNVEDPFGAIYDDSDLISEYRKSRFREDVNLHDFNDMEDILKWGELNQLNI